MSYEKNDFIVFLKITFGPEKQDLYINFTLYVHKSKAQALLRKQRHLNYVSHFYESRNDIHTSVHIKNTLFNHFLYFVMFNENLK